MAIEQNNVSSTLKIRICQDIWKINENKVMKSIMQFQSPNLQQVLPVPKCTVSASFKNWTYLKHSLFLTSALDYDFYMWHEAIEKRGATYKLHFIVY